jgi:hypothetical protein
LEKRVEDGRKRRSRVLREVVRHADSADARRIEKMDTTDMSTSLLVMTRCLSRAQEEEEEGGRRGKD